MKIETFLKRNLKDQSGKTYLITGANSGIGLATTTALAKAHARIYMACRNEEKAKKAIQEIQKKVPNADLHYVYYDQSKEEVIALFSESMRDIPLDGIFFNAGIFHANPELLHRVNVEGVQKAYQLLVQSHPQSRYVFSTSLVAKNKKKQDAFSCYSRSKYELNQWVEQQLQYQPNLYLFHPGIAATSIASSENSTYPKWFQKLAKVGMRVLFMKKEKACLGAVLALAGNYPAGSYIYPRGIWEYRGYPKWKTIGGKKNAHR